MTQQRNALRIVLQDRVVGYHPVLAHVMAITKGSAGEPASSAANGIWLTQLMFWDRWKKETADNRGQDYDDWVFKSEVELRDETGLSRRECQTAKKTAIALGIVETEVRGVPPTSHYRVDYKRLGKLVEEVYKRKSIARRRTKQPTASRNQLHGVEQTIARRRAINSHRPIAETRVNTGSRRVSESREYTESTKRKSTPRPTGGDGFVPLSRYYFEALKSLGIVHANAVKLSEMPHVTASYIQAWCQYSVANKAQCKTNPRGVLGGGYFYKQMSVKGLPPAADQSAVFASTWRRERAERMAA